MREATGLQPNLVNMRDSGTVEGQRVNDIRNVVAPATRRLMMMQSSLLREELEREVERIVREFETAAVTVEEAITQRVEAGLQSLLEEETNRILRNALDSIDLSRFNTVSKPTWPTNVSIPSQRSDRNEDNNRPGSGNGINETNRRLSSLEEHPAASQGNPLPASQGSSLNSHHESVQNIPAKPVQTMPIMIDREEIYEGIVRINVAATESSRQIVKFVRELRQQPQLRVLRFEGSHKDGVSIWLRLREPLCLINTFAKLDNIAFARSQEGGVLDVRLKAEERMAFDARSLSSLMVAEPIPA